MTLESHSLGKASAKAEVCRLIVLKCFHLDSK